MHQQNTGAACPGCTEPLEPGDLFCGACGCAAPAGPAPDDRADLGGSLGTAVRWPAARADGGGGTPAPPQSPADLPALDSTSSHPTRPAPAPPAPETGTPPTPGSAPASAPGPLSGPAPGEGPGAGRAQTAGAATGPPTAHAPIAVPGAAANPHANGTPVTTPGESPTAGPAPAAGTGTTPAAAGPPASRAQAAAPRSEPAADSACEAGTPAVPGSVPASAPTPLSGPAPAAGPARGSGAAPGPLAGGAPQVPAGREAAGQPDPRTVPPAALAVSPETAKMCVACRAGRVDTDGYCENCGHAQPRERDHLEQGLGSVAAVSDRGLRHHRNEDAFAVSSTALPDGSPAVVAIVCDGVSSASRPDEASAAAASAASELLLEALPRGVHPQQAMHDAILAAAEAVDRLAVQPGGDGEALEHDPRRRGSGNAPACTIVGAVAAGGLLVVGWVGDSRVYWVPDDRTGPSARLTEDDSWAAQMVAAGLMTEAEAYADARAHAITGWLGADAGELDPHTASFKPDRSGVAVVCTDGLWNYAEAPENMARAIPPDAADRPLHSAQVLVGHALDGGGHDNVTVAVLPFAVDR